jgi:hypothetical protein
LQAQETYLLYQPSATAARLVLAIALASFLPFFGCGYDQRLDSITIEPNNVTITGAGLDVHYTALGHYSHPPNAKNITDQLTWASSTPQIITVDQQGVATSGLGCGTNLEITATSNTNTPKSDSVIVGRVIVNVKQPTGTDPNCT